MKYILLIIGLIKPMRVLKPRMLKLLSNKIKLASKVNARNAMTFKCLKFCPIIFFNIKQMN